MLKLNLPKFDFKLIKENNYVKIFDEIRKKYLVLTPEEWVRQNLIKYLISAKGYKATTTSIEKMVNINGNPKRFDIVFYKRDLKPFLLVECKAPSVRLDQSTVDQIAVYNGVLNAEYMLLSNGMNHICFQNTDEGVKFLKEIPEFKY
jgi:hypothetical protein